MQVFEAEGEAAVEGDDRDNAAEDAGDSLEGGGGGELVEAPLVA